MMRTQPSSTQPPSNLAIAGAAVRATKEIYWHHECGVFPGLFGHHILCAINVQIRRLGGLEAIEDTTVEQICSVMTGPENATSISTKRVKTLIAGAIRTGLEANMCRFPTPKISPDLIVDENAGRER